MLLSLIEFGLFIPTQMTEWNRICLKVNTTIHSTSENNVASKTAYSTTLKHIVIMSKSRSHSQNPSPSTSMLPKHDSNFLIQLTYMYSQQLYPSWQDQQGASHKRCPGVSKSAVHVALPHVCAVVTLLCPLAHGVPVPACVSNCSWQSLHSEPSSCSDMPITSRLSLTLSNAVLCGFHFPEL